MPCTFSWQRPRGGERVDPAMIAAIQADLERCNPTDLGQEQRETREAILGITAALRSDLPGFREQPDTEWVGDCYRGLDIMQLAAGAAGLTALAGYANQVADLLIPLENGSQGITVELATIMEEVFALLEGLAGHSGAATPREQRHIDYTLTALRIHPDPMPDPCFPLDPSPVPRPLGEILLEQNMVTEQDLFSGLNKQPFLGEILVQEGKLSPQERDRALAIQKQQVDQSIRDAAVTIRVDVNKLNRLINLAGEIGQFQGSLEQRLATLEQQVDALAATGRRTKLFDPYPALHASRLALLEIAHQGQQLIRALQGQAVTLRMIPVGGLLHSFQRLVRDAARQTGKLVRLTVQGAETEVDKNIVERLSDPFKHLLRNAIDHGIESPEQREILGKPSHGTILLRAYHQGGRLCIDVQDDGRGMNVAHILACAREKNWLQAGEEPSEAAVLDLLFRPGFSTAKAVTDISGRGVGLDVVRQEIQAMHGTIELQHRVGQGTLFRIQLPLTLTTVEGVTVRVGAQYYIVPALSIVTSLRPDPASWQNVADAPTKRQFTWQGESLLLFTLRHLLGLNEEEKGNKTAVLLVVQDGERMAGLLVDEILEQKPVLVKNLDEHFYVIPGMMGATILDDGRVSLILDIPWLLRQQVPARNIQ
ncbi:MAG: chemotaxis protein CheW [Magnetococcus sp. YQC-3]